MKKIFVLIASIASTLAIHADNIDNDIERANQLIETDVAHAMALCDSISVNKLSPAQKGKLYHTIGNSYFALGETENAIKAFDISIASAQTAKDSTTLASSLSDKGICYRISEKPDSALLLYNRALHILEKIDAPREEAYLLTSIAVLYANLGRFDEAIKYGKKAFNIAKGCDDAEAIMYAGQTLGIVLYLKGDKKDGFAIEREMVDIAERHKLPRYILKTYASIIDMHYKDGRRDSVEYYLSKGNEIMSDVPEASVESLGFLEESYVVLSAYGDYQKSLDIQKKILSMKGAGTFMPFNKLFLRMARNYEKLGDIKRMGECYERSIEISDSLHGVEIDKQLSEFDVKYETSQRKLEIARLEVEKSRQRLWLTVVLILSIVIIASCIVFFISRNKRMKRELELSAMRNQLDAIDQERARFAAELHDGICSDLTGIALLMQTPAADTNEIVELIDNVRNDVRSISHSLMPPRLEGLTLLQLLRNLALRYDGKISVIQDSPFSDRQEVEFQIYRIIQECIENINKHSSAENISITISKGNIDICDDGEIAASNQSSGIGMQTILKRAASIGAKISKTRTNGKNHINIYL